MVFHVIVEGMGNAEFEKQNYSPRLLYPLLCKSAWTHQVPSNAHRHQFLIRKYLKRSVCPYGHWNTCESPCSSTGCDNTQTGASSNTEILSEKSYCGEQEKGLEEWKSSAEGMLDNTWRSDLFPAEHTPCTRWAWKKVFLEESNSDINALKNSKKLVQESC